MIIKTSDDLKAYLKQNSLTQQDIAELLNISIVTANSKINNLTFNIIEINKIANITNEIIILGGE